MGAGEIGKRYRLSAKSAPPEHVLEVFGGTRHAVLLAPWGPAEGRTRGNGSPMGGKAEGDGWKRTGPRNTWGRGGGGDGGQGASNPIAVQLRCRHQTSRSLKEHHSCTGDTQGTNERARGTGTKELREN